MNIEYVAQAGNIQYEISGWRGVLQSAKSSGDVPVSESDYSQAPALVQAAFVAVKDLTERSEGKAVFNPATATIRWGGNTYTPENYQEIEQADVKAFAETIYTYNNSEQAKVYEALQLEIIEPESKPEPLTPEQEKELARRQIIQDFDNGVKALTSGYTENEVKSWDAKRRESEIILSGSDEPTPTVDAICQGLGTDRVEYANRINQKVQAYGAAYGVLEAKMKRDLAALEE